MTRSDQTCDRCGREVSYLDSPVALVDVLRLRLCLTCQNDWSGTVLWSAEGAEYALSFAAYEAGIRGGSVIVAEEATGRHWLAKRVMFDFARHWLEEGKAEAGRGKARCGDSSLG